ncbi:spore-cortex-lytic enzyme [Clostridium sp. CAG:389]|nr:spore-cortex-lytic enzyme [Clostridium sp. CAG:389]
MKILLKGDNVKKYLKIILTIIFIILSTICIFIVDKGTINNVSLAKTTSTSDIQLMARAINGEARGEPYEGQVAVGAVILNRVKDSRFPNSISGVIYQPGAFTAVSDGQINAAISEGSTVYKAAQDAMNGWDPTGGCVYYFNPSTATNKWIWSRPLIKTIGKHRFCK